MKKRNLQVKQLSHKMQDVSHLQQIAVPETGWLKTIRLSIGMSLEQLGRKLGISKQSAMDIERREREGSVTLRALREAATAMDMDLVYGFVPKDGSISNLIDRKAHELATKIVGMASQHMVLENQENSKERLEEAIRERTNEIREKMPRILWD